jgi:hypothetical protein
LALLVSSASAYEGEFCYGVYLHVNQDCISNTVSNIRRAIGHGADWTEVIVSGIGGGRSGECYSDGCTADTGYLAVDITGNGFIENIGGGGGGYYYGWLYP